jgi:hypothetical protein
MTQKEPASLNDFNDESREALQGAAPFFTKLASAIHSGGGVVLSADEVQAFGKMLEAFDANALTRSLVDSQKPSTLEAMIIE